jgi:hypothetical protein
MLPPISEHELMAMRRYFLQLQPTAESREYGIKLLDEIAHLNAEVKLLNEVAAIHIYEPVATA